MLRLPVFGLFCLAIVGFAIACGASESWTCTDEEVAGFCDDPYTLAGFTAAICGRDEVRFEGTAIKYISLDRTDREPDDIRFAINCDGVDVAWEAPAPDWDDFESVGDAPAVNDQTRLLIRLMQQYTEGDIDIDTAREILIAE